MSSEFVMDRSKRSQFQAPRGQGMTKARDSLLSYLLDLSDAGECLPAGRSANGVSLKEVARAARISVRSTQRMRPLIGRWATTLGTEAKTRFGEMA